jgi:hypothetical protein
LQQYWGIWGDIALGLFGLSALVLAVGSVWLRAKRFSQNDRNRSEIASLHRLDRIEEIVEASALEIERIAEGQRYASKLLAERGNPLPVERAPERIITPH